MEVVFVDRMVRPLLKPQGEGLALGKSGEERCRQKELQDQRD